VDVQVIGTKRFKKILLFNVLLRYDYFSRVIVIFGLPGALCSGIQTFTWLFTTAAIGMLALK
jgi:hypothetical protein